MLAESENVGKKQGVLNMKYVFSEQLGISIHMQIFASPCGVQDFRKARKRERVMAVTPNMTQAKAGSFLRLYQGSD